jgi:hypothetical protein
MTELSIYHIRCEDASHDTAYTVPCSITYPEPMRGGISRYIDPGSVNLSLSHTRFILIFSFGRQGGVFN